MEIQKTCSSNRRRNETHQSEFCLMGKGSLSVKELVESRKATRGRINLIPVLPVGPVDHSTKVDQGRSYSPPKLPAGWLPGSVLFHFFLTNEFKSFMMPCAFTTWENVLFSINKIKTKTHFSQELQPEHD